MKRLNFKTSLPSKRPLAQMDTAARARPKTLRKYKNLVWDSVRFGKVKRFHSKPRRGRGGYISRCARRSTEGSRHNAYQKHGLHIHNSHHHHWMHSVSGCQLPVSGTHHTEHGTPNTEHGPHHHHHGHHHHGHHHHSHHHHAHHAHDGFSSWFFQSFWRVAGLDPYAVCIAKHSAKEIAKLKQRVAHATHKGTHHSISLGVHKAHHPKSIKQNPITEKTYKTESHRAIDQNPKQVTPSKPSYFWNGSKRIAVNNEKPPPTPAASSLQVTSKVLKKTGEKLHYDTKIKLKTLNPKPITYAPGSTIKNPKITNRMAEVHDQRSMIQNQKPKTLHTKSNSESLTLVTSKTGQKISSTLGTGHQIAFSVFSPESCLNTRHRTLDTEHTTLNTTHPKPETSIGYISSSIPIRLIYPKVTVGAAALPE